MVWPVLLALVSVVVVVVRVVLVRRHGDAAGNQTTAVAFAPPRAVTPGVSAVLLRQVKDADAIPAEILDLAVRGVWQVGVVDGEGQRDKVWFVQREDTGEPDLPAVPRAIYRAVFPVGSGATRVELTPDADRTARMEQAVEIARAEVIQRGWLAPGLTTAVRRSGLAGVGVLAAGLVTLMGGVPAAALPFVGIAILGGFATQLIKPKPWRLTPEGRRITDELEGLRLYMTMAETDRLKVLQAPETAERVPALRDGPGEIAKLHERLLPYAVLFGILPQWSEVVKHDYQQAEYVPTWLYVADVMTDLMWLDFLTGGGLDLFGALGDFGTDLDAAGLDAAGLDAAGPGDGFGDGFGDGGGGDGGGLFGGGDGGDGGGLFGGGGDGGGLFDGFDFDF